MSIVQPGRRRWTRSLASIHLGAWRAGGLAVWLVPISLFAQAPPDQAPVLTPALAFPGGVATAAPLTPSPSGTSTPGPSATAGVDTLRRQLGAGDVVSLVSTADGSLRGRVIQIGETALELRAETTQPGGKRRALTLTIPLDAIQSLDRPRDSWRNGTLIGAGVGAGVGMAFFAHAAAIDANEMDEWAAGYVAGAVVMTGLGALIGWAIDAAHSKPHFRYERARESGPSVRLALPGAGGKGLAAVVSF